ncbi:hypothetical protein GF312_14350 [Candidatus Poribacteria bacterium]|nr:hypothetical protein [Candidatus Poribacteria bacterium]
MQLVEKKTYARVGLMGNPSDGFYGKTISACITNFCATVTLTENEHLSIIPHKLFDPTEFASLEDLEATSKRDGYYGGLRLIYATCKKFSEYCRQNNIKLEDKNCEIRYNTNIPRQLGLGGSSAIIVSLFKALMDFYNVNNNDIPLKMQPNLILSVETEELGINAGLQDRVIQTYGGMIFMDFARSIMDETGHGKYERIDTASLPNLFIAYVNFSGKDSGKMHNNTRFRFNQGDKEIVDAMSRFAGFAVEAKHALEEEDYERFNQLMDMNFDLRRKIYGDKLIGKRNLQMVDIARKHDTPAKFTGSGGTIVGTYRDREHFLKLKEAYLRHGFRFEKAVPQNLY